MIPSCGLILVRPVETDETQPGGRILFTADTRERMTSAQCEVIAVGRAALCNESDNEDCARKHIYETRGEYGEDRVHPCPVRVEDWLLVKPRSFLAGPVPERKEWFVHQDDVLAILTEGVTDGAI